MQNINIDIFEGDIPDGHDLVVYERDGNPDDGYVLYGFDEVGDFDSAFKSPQYCFLGVFENAGNG